MIGDEYNVPTLAVLRTIDEVSNYSFPEACCIKPTHASGMTILRKRGEKIDYKKIEHWFSINYYTMIRNANYRALKPKVIVEPLVFSDSNVIDYKIFCHNGQPKLIQVDVDRYLNHARKFFDSEWNELDFSVIYPKTLRDIAKPDNFALMKNIASVLSSKFGFVRVDLYSDGTKCLVGEITNCSDNASGNFIPHSGELSASKLMFS
jgi:hypothetical protein